MRSGALPRVLLLAGLALGTLPAGAKTACCTCGCAAKPVVRHVTVGRTAAKRAVRENFDAEYAQSFYDYRSTSTVTESFEAEGAESTDWWGAPDRAASHFHHRAHGGAEVELDSRYFSGGVGASAGAYAYGGGFVDGYGQVHYGSPMPYGMNGYQIGNGGYGGFAAGAGSARMRVWHGYNHRNGIGNGY